jgi:hypothetical protein
MAVRGVVGQFASARHRNVPAGEAAIVYELGEVAFNTGKSLGVEAHFTGVNVDR